MPPGTRCNTGKKTDHSRLRTPVLLLLLLYVVYTWYNTVAPALQSKTRRDDSRVLAYTCYTWQKRCRMKQHKKTSMLARMHECSRIHRGQFVRVGHIGAEPKTADRAQHTGVRIWRRHGGSMDAGLSVHDCHPGYHTVLFRGDIVQYSECVNIWEYVVYIGLIVGMITWNISPPVAREKHRTSWYRVAMTWYGNTTANPTRRRGQKRCHLHERVVHHQ